MLQCILIGGDDISDVFLDDAVNLTGTGVNTITMGFEPDLTFFTTTGLASSSTSATDSHLSFGAVVNDGLDTQGSIIQNGDNGVLAANPSITVGYNSNTAAVGRVTSGLDWQQVVTGHTATGLTTQVSGGDSGTAVFAVLGFKFTNSPDVAIFDTQYPTAGDYSQTGVGFQPNFGLIVSAQEHTAVNTLSSAGDPSMANAYTAFDETVLSTHTFHSVDGSVTSTTGNLSDLSLRVLSGLGATRVQSSGYAFTADGWDFTLTTNPTTQIHGWGLAIGPGAAANFDDTNAFTITIASGGVDATGAVTGQAASTTGQVTANLVRSTGAVAAQAAISTGQVYPYFLVTSTGAVIGQGAVTTGQSSVDTDGVLITLTLVNESGTPLANLSNLQWAFFDQALPSTMLAPVDQGTDESTDGSGVLEVRARNSALTPGQTGYFIVSDTDGTEGQSPAQQAFAGPVGTT